MSVIQPVVPTITATCPSLATGTVTVLNQSVQLWVGTKQAGKKGSVLFYWHGSGGQSSEANSEMGSQITEIMANGGMVASFTTSTVQGESVGNTTWYAGDYAMADILLACAVQQLNIDTTRVYTSGCSVGGLASGAMAYLRSSYIAGAMPNSGGIVHPFTLQEPRHVPSVITAHGSFNNDVLSVHLQTTSLDECHDLSSRGSFDVDCEHAAGHCGAPPALIAAQWTFLQAHPFGVTPEPYASGLPGSFPSYCTIITSSGAPPTPVCSGQSDCGAGKSCCFTIGPNGSTITGTTRTCATSGAQNGAYGRCPTGQYELCTTNSDCAGGQTCDGFSCD